MLEKLNKLSQKELFTELFKCCGSTFWAEELSKSFPFLDFQDLLKKSDEIWDKATENDGLEAFTHHPKIGDTKNLEEKFASTKTWAGNEQSGVAQAAKSVIEDLAKGNKDYEEKFGFIFIVCATGKSAAEMLALLNERIVNTYATESKIAMQEQNKITKIRLEKLIA
jgi:2-oxo-4-hydroxy-4-carboxy-5-ureidoimidazoline decarboxylase